MMLKYADRFLSTLMRRRMKTESIKLIFEVLYVLIEPEFLEEDANPLDGLPLGRVGQNPSCVAAASAAGRDSGQVLQHGLHGEHELQALQVRLPCGRGAPSQSV